MELTRNKAVHCLSTYPSLPSKVYVVPSAKEAKATLFLNLFPNRCIKAPYLGYNPLSPKHPQVYPQYNTCICFGHWMKLMLAVESTEKYLS